ncbi:hypothetical protein RVR_10596 [Actinacidiphila reveromycinica]|uniref:Uncharacterized protein n=1 Tax=Actinacidiphila reveromycinica TaxID=659352 RepID=A0A7U3UXQ7_9ACTN|nr:hypothetical protein [Streptomyces sp. SN-593]BBB00597.1 hypothetical protein RVR_7732 [Streptomyces sp. SN-593]BBB00650.1 hypothetical protein RVR_10596 [Streptomyces sp. SN-593]
MTPADRVIADAVAAVIAARIAAALLRYGLPTTETAETADTEARQAVRDLRRDGWHITALPITHHPEAPR